jgi:cytochrome c biogenesis protein CcmG/thiol:disulfide interchange protein DsbE
MSGARLTPALLLLSAMLAASVPDFSLKDLGGRDVTLRQHRGRVVLVNFWATWCPPCRIEIPWLMALQERFGDRLIVLGVAMDEGGARAVAPWVQRERFPANGSYRPLSYPVLIGSETVANDYEVESLPATFVVGTDGALVRRIDGPFDLTDLERSIRSLVSVRQQDLVDAVDGVVNHKEQ